MLPGRTPSYELPNVEQRSLVGQINFNKCSMDPEGATIIARQMLYRVRNLQGFLEFTLIPFGVYVDDPVRAFPIWLENQQILDTSPIDSDLSFHLRWKETQGLISPIYGWNIEDGRKTGITFHRYVLLRLDKREGGPGPSTTIWETVFEPLPLFHLGADSSMDVGTLRVAGCFPMTG
jgi:hypothetical protein